MKIKVIEAYAPRPDLKGAPVEVVHAFPGTKIDDHRTLVSAQFDGTVGETEVAYARERCKLYLLDRLELDVEVKVPDAKAAEGKKP